MDFSALLGNLCGGELASDNLGGGVEGEVDLRGGQVHLLQTVGQAGDSSGGSVDENLVQVDHVHDGGNLALLGSVGQEGNAANLDKLLERHSSLLVEVNQAMLAWSFPHCSLLCVYQNCICCLFNYFYERYIDKDSTSNFSLDYLINILEFYFRTIYFGFETSRHQVHKASWTRDVLFLCIK